MFCFEISTIFLLFFVFFWCFSRCVHDPFTFVNGLYPRKKRQKTCQFVLRRVFLYIWCFEKKHQKTWFLLFFYVFWRSSKHWENTFFVKFFVFFVILMEKKSFLYLISWEKIKQILFLNFILFYQCYQEIKK